MSISDEGYQVALHEAQEGLKEGGIPVGGAIISKDGKLLGRGRNGRIQKGSAVLHGETAAFESAAHLPMSAFKGSTVYTTLSPCPMCAGAMLFFKVERVVIADNKNMNGREELLRSQGVEVVVINDQECIKMMSDFIRDHPEKWQALVPPPPQTKFEPALLLSFGLRGLTRTRNSGKKAPKMNERESLAGGV